MIELSKFLEGTVTRVIISQSPADSSTDGASHPTEFEEEHKYKGKSFSCLVFIITTTFQMYSKI